WVVRRVLGEVIPPPPAVVPELPRDEAKMELPLRDMLAKHRQEAGCAACHARFDSLGLALEGYGPVGELRTKDLAGHPVDARATFPGGAEGNGLEGIRTYIKQHRQNDFIDGLCRKMMVYALGRSLMLSDEPAIETMRARLAANGFRMNTLVESIVTTPQFLTKGGPCFPEKGERTKMPCMGTPFSRRAVPRGIGVPMSLPWLQSLSFGAETPGATALPKRFA